jgi:hypothetical protein
VLWGTIPHVTVAPIARGLGADVKTKRRSPYFPAYTRPWISERSFSARDPHLTGGQAQQIDWAVNAYNVAIERAVVQHRRRGLDWRLVDICSVLDGLAFRRFLDDPRARPRGWQPTVLPDPVADRKLDTRFYKARDGTIEQGGLFSLDGVHPTTVGYGLVAQAFIDAMPETVNFSKGRAIDFEALCQEDTLVAQPLTNVDRVLDVLQLLDESWDMLRAVIPFGRAAASTSPSPMSAVTGSRARTRTRTR